jgi:hypothetical protein
VDAALALSALLADQHEDLEMALSRRIDAVHATILPGIDN